MTPRIVSTALQSSSESNLGCLAPCANAQQNDSSITIVIPGKPQARQAHGIATRNGHAIKYLRPESARWQNLVSLVARSKFTEPLNGAVAMEVLIVYQAPRTGITKAQNEALNKGELLLLPKVADIDNVLKCIFDGLKGIAFFDDRQVTDLGVAKRMGRKPMTIVTIRAIHE